MPEAVGRDPFALITASRARTKKLVFATGIANIYARDAMTMNAIQQTVGELTGGRFVLGPRRLARARWSRACAATSTASP